MPNSTYLKHMVVITVIWTVCSFSFYLMNFMNKYYEGNIFLNYYLEGLSQIIGCLFAYPIYACLRIRWSFVLVFAISIVFLVLLLIHQQDYVSSRWVFSFGGQESLDDQENTNDKAKRIVIPLWIFFTKIWIQAANLYVYQAAYNEDVIFPFYKRATSIGIINFISRSFTIASPMIAELDKPIPTIILLAAVFLALVASFFLPSKKDEVDLEEEKKTKLKEE